MTDWDYADQRAHRRLPYQQAATQDPELEAELTERRRLESFLDDYVLDRSERDAAERRMKKSADEFKEWLEKHPDDMLVDGEHNIRAYLEARQGPESADIQRAPQDLILLLHDLNLLTVNIKGLNEQPAGSEARERMRPYIHRTNGSVALQVKTKE